MIQGEGSQSAAVSRSKCMSERVITHSSSPRACFYRSGVERPQRTPHDARIVVRPEVHDDSPVQVRPKEGPSHLGSSPPAFEETRALKRGVKPSSRKVQPTSPQHEVKSAASSL